MFWGLGQTNSHSTIRELAGLDSLDATTFAFEWQPPSGWPNADWHDGLAQDTPPIPAWEMKTRHLVAIETHLRARYPDMAAWAAPDAPPAADDLRMMGWTLLRSGAVVAPKQGDRYYVTDGAVKVVGQTGGDCRGYGQAVMTVTGQTGGDCRGYDQTTMAVTGQTGGDCWGYDQTTML